LPTCLSSVPKRFGPLPGPSRRGGDRGSGISGRTRASRGFRAAFLDELSSLHGDDGARQFIKQHPEWVKLFEVDDPGAVRDIDKPSDLER